MTRSAFDCGIPALNDYLHTRARQDQERGAAAVFVLRSLQDDPRRLMGYFTLSAAVIDLSTLPTDLAAKLPRYPVLPAALIGRLALDRAYHGECLGAYLLIHGLKRALQLSRTEIGITAVLVDAKDDRARAFYLRYGFLADLTDSRCLFLPIATIATAFGGSPA